MMLPNIETDKLAESAYNLKQKEPNMLVQTILDLSESGYLKLC